MPSAGDVQRVAWGEEGTSWGMGMQPYGAAQGWVQGGLGMWLAAGCRGAGGIGVQVGLRSDQGRSEGSVAQVQITAKASGMARALQTVHNIDRGGSSADTSENAPAPT